MQAYFAGSLYANVKTARHDLKKVFFYEAFLININQTLIFFPTFELQFHLLM